MDSTLAGAYGAFVADAEYGGEQVMRGLLIGFASLALVACTKQGGAVADQGNTAANVVEVAPSPDIVALEQRVDDLESKTAAQDKDIDDLKKQVAEQETDIDSIQSKLSP